MLEVKLTNVGTDQVPGSDKIAYIPSGLVLF
jgi:hypothetical protein